MTDLVHPHRGEIPAEATLAVGPVNSWRGSHEYHRECPCFYSSYEITAIGGRQGDDYPDALSVARSVLSAAFMPGCEALELRYVSQPDAPGLARTRMFVTAKSCLESVGDQLAIAAASQAVAALPNDFVVEPAVPTWIPGGPGGSEPVLELKRTEEVTQPIWDYVPADFYYYIIGTPGDGSGWQRFWRALASVASQTTISVLVKRTELDAQERHVMGSVATQLAQYAVTRQEYGALGNPLTYPGCENAAVALEAWRDRIHQLQEPLLARVAVRGPASTSLPIATLLSGAIAESSDPAVDVKPMPVEAPRAEVEATAASEGFDWLEIFPWGGSPIWEYDNAPSSLRRVRYLYGIDEAAGLAILPMPDEQGVPGFVRARRIVPRRAMVDGMTSDSGVLVGALVHEGSPTRPAHIPLGAINRHVLVAGTPGSGKTTTVLTLLASLWRDFHIPFLAIEPSKSEYRTLLAAPGMDDLRVVVLGRDDLAPMRLNPLSPPSGVRMEVQANAVLAALKASLPLPPPLPQLLEDSIERAYLDAGWDFDTTIDDGLAPPSLRTVLASFRRIFQAAGYVGEAKNVAAALETRLRSLIRGSRGRVLDTVESVDFADLLAKPVLVEMDEIADPDDKAILTTFLLDRVRAEARRRGSSGGLLRHVTAVEEAHRLLPRVTPGEGGDGQTTRAAGVEAFCNAIAELRGVGEGFILSSQSPSRLAAAAVDNCSTRVLHHIESAADRDVVTADFDASPREREAAARLRQGEALARWPGVDEPEVIQVIPGPGIDSSVAVRAEYVQERMSAGTVHVRRMLPYPLCTREVCTLGCDPVVRAAGERVANAASAFAAQAWDEHEGTVRALEPITRHLLHQAAGDVQTAYCGAAHVAAFGAAFMGPRQVDMRPKIRAVLEADRD